MAGFKFSIDIGGTFVDAVVFDFISGELVAYKLPTTPADPAKGVISAIGQLPFKVSDIFEFVHGTTLGLNAVIERKGTRVGIITNLGFEDIFEIGRGSLEFVDMYRFDYEQPPNIIERRNVRGVRCRMDAYGNEVETLDEGAVVSAGRELAVKAECGALAVCFLHSYTDDRHERRAVELLKEHFPGTEVSAGAALAREYREYERTSTAVLDAYIKPVLRNYLGRVATGLDSSGYSGSKYVMNSSGGALTFEMGEASPISTVMSGPAGGVAGARYIAQSTEARRVLSIDVGGTSLDACLILDYDPVDVFEARIDCFPILQPIFDIRTLGAGGGSIARVDNALLRVGPQSAGADPGPACYGRGGQLPTVTDASLALGYMDADNFLGGDMTVSPDLASKALQEHLCGKLAISVEEAATSVFDVLVSRTSSSIREMLLERGLGPRDFTMLAFGGCGPLLGPMIQRELELPELLVPHLPSVFSAWGMMVSDLSFTESTSILEAVSPHAMAILRRAATGLAERSVREFREKTGSEASPRLVLSVRMRFIGQEHTLSVTYLTDDTEASLFGRFSDNHLERFGHTFDESAEIVSLTIKLTLVTRKPALAAGHATQSATPTDSRSRMFDFASRTFVDVPRRIRSTLEVGEDFHGPMIIEDESSVIVVHGDQHCTITDNGLISLKPRDE